MISWVGLFISVLFSFQFCSGDTEDQLKNVIEFHNPDPKCVFNYTEIDSKTIKNFPKCEKVYGILVINENTDLSLEKLIKAFKTMTTLVGGIRVENSSLSSISFFKSDPSTQRFWLSCNYSGIYIQDNKNLSDANVIANISSLWPEDLNHCDVEISNNPKLDLWNLCWKDTLKTLVNLRTFGNLVNCGCQGDRISNMSFEEVHRCPIFYNGVKIYNVFGTETSTFSGIYKIMGFLDVQNTGIQSLSFLEKMEYFQVFTKGEEVILNLENNRNMTRLVLSVMNGTKNEMFENFNLHGYQTANFEYLHPDFCLTTSEFEWFADYGFHFINLHAKLCQLFDAEDIVCRFESMSKLPNNCRYITGDIIIDSGDEEHVTKLSGVWHLYGTLTIRNTNLVDFSFFKYFMFIADLENTKPIVKILNNKNLTNPKISSVKTVFTRNFYKRDAIIQDNHPDMWNSTEGICNIFGIISNEMMMFRRSLNYTGGDCAPKWTTFLKNQQKLASDLFEGYDNSISPVYSDVDPSKPIGYDPEAPTRFNYILFLWYLKLIEVIEPQEKVSVILEISEAWVDPRLSWDPKDYNGIKMLFARQDKVWSPTLNSYKVADMVDLRDQDFRSVSIDNFGHINTTVSVRMSLNCPLNVNKFPFDTQKCVIQFSMPLFEFQLVELHTQIYFGILRKAVWTDMGNSEWNLINLTNRVDVLTYGESYTDYQLATFEITIRRNPMYYIYMIVLPSFIINTLSIIGVFMRKTDRMSKLNVGLTNIMTMTFILGVMADKIPKTGSIPLLGIHIVVNLFITVAAIAVTVFIDKIRKISRRLLKGRDGFWRRKIEWLIEDYLDFICMIILLVFSFVNFFVVIGFWIANT